MDIKNIIANNPLIRDMVDKKEVVWINPKEINYTFMHYQIYFDKKFQVILFKNLYVYTRSAPAGNSYKFWIDSTPECGNDAFKYFSEHYLISQPTMNR